MLCPQRELAGDPLSNTIVYRRVCKDVLEEAVWVASDVPLSPLTIFDDGGRVCVAVLFRGAVTVACAA